MPLRRRLAIALGLNQTAVVGHRAFYLPAVIADPAAREHRRVALRGARCVHLAHAGDRRLPRHALASGSIATEDVDRSALSIMVIAVGQIVLASAPNLLDLVCSPGRSSASAWRSACMTRRFPRLACCWARMPGRRSPASRCSPVSPAPCSGPLGAALIGVLGWRGLLLLYADPALAEPADGAAARATADAPPIAIEAHTSTSDA